MICWLSSLEEEVNLCRSMQRQWAQWELAQPQAQAAEEEAAAVGLAG